MTEEKKEELTEEQKQFEVEAAALKRSIRKNKSASRFTIFVLFVVWGAVILDAIEAFMLPGGELTLKHISAQSTIHFHCLFAYIYTLWCCYIIPKNGEECQSAIEAFLKKWAYLSEKEEDTEADNSCNKSLS